jgi:hypothetical protein
VRGSCKRHLTGFTSSGQGHAADFLPSPTREPLTRKKSGRPATLPQASGQRSGPALVSTQPHLRATAPLAAPVLHPRSDASSTPGGGPPAGAAGGGGTPTHDAHARTCEGWLPATAHDRPSWSLVSTLGGTLAGWRANRLIGPRSVVGATHAACWGADGSRCARADAAGRAAAWKLSRGVRLLAGIAGGGVGGRRGARRTKAQVRGPSHRRRSVRQ